MIKQMRYAEAEDLQKIRQIWKVCFGDEDSYLDFYFQNGYPRSQTLVLTTNQEVVSMLTLMPVTLQMPKTCQKGCYVYAVATDPAFRGHGLMRELMGFAEAVAKQQKCDFLTLVPATTPLFEMYEKLGYQICTRLEETAALPKTTEVAEVAEVAEVSWTAIAKKTYFARRNDWLSTLPCRVVFSDESYLMAEMDCTGCQTIAFQWEGAEEIAAVYTEKDTLVIREISVNLAQLPAVSNALSVQFGCSSWRAKTKDGTVPYAMMKGLTEQFSIPSCYMNLMLD